MGSRFVRRNWGDDFWPGAPWVVSLVLLLLLAVISWSSWRHPGTPQRGLYFISIGDFGTGSASQKAVAAQMARTVAEYDVQFIVGLGDNMYQRGVKEEDDPRFDEQFKDIYLQYPSLRVPWYMALGDHDHRGNVAAQVAYKHWLMPAPYHAQRFSIGGGKELALVFTDSIGLEGYLAEEGEERRFIKDYTPELVDKKAGTTQWEWLQRTLKDSKAHWLLVVGHRPLLSCANRSRFAVEERLKETLLPVLLQNHVDAYLSGHDHIGQHLDVDGFTLMGNGVGGYGNHPMLPLEQVVWARDDYQGFILHHVTEKELESRFMDSNGTILYVKVLQKLSPQQETQALRKHRKLRKA